MSFTIAGCNLGAGNNQIEVIKQRGELRVGTLYNATSYRLLDDTPTGLDYELAADFAAKLGVKLKMVPAYQQQELFDLLRNGQVDLLAAGLAVTPKRQQWLRFGPAYYQVQQKLVYHLGKPKPSSIDQIQEPIVVIRGSSQEDLLSEIEPLHPSLRWEAKAEGDSEELLRQVADGEIPYTLVSDALLAQNQRFYPELAEAIPLADATPVGWALPQGPDGSLFAAVTDFFQQRKQDGTLAKLDEKYFGHVQHFDHVDTQAFLARAQKRLPRYKSLFERHAQDLDWRLLAAVSYQESHWQADARSYTGVRGLMMLTKRTASEVGVTDRVDPEQSIRGGATYLRKLIDQVPATVHPDEKIWFALAAYNMGLGHMLDARRITKLRGRDPDAWHDVKESLPLLHEARWYRRARHGYARGREARLYVSNIRRYYQSLRMVDAIAQRQEQQASEMPWSKLASNTTSRIRRLTGIPR